VAVTEAPTYNILKWTASEYVSWGAVRKMSAIGYHDKNIWLSVLFQLTYALAVMQEKQIYIQDFSLEDNVFIKDLDPKLSQNKHWKYVVGNFEFYVPNQGYLLIIDSNFKDVQQDKFSIKKETKPVHKIISTIFGNENTPSMSGIEIENNIFKSFKKCMDPNNFNFNNTQQKLNLPDVEILKLMEIIFKDNSSTKIKDYLPKYFNFFLHNRVGTILNKSELEYVDEDRIDLNFKEGDICIYCPEYKLFTVAIYLGKIDSDISVSRWLVQHRILTKNDKKEFVEQKVTRGKLYKLVYTQILDQNYDVNSKSLTQNEILETYRLE